MPTIEQTLAFARAAHKGQTDKGGHPYHEHVERVALRVGAKLAALSLRTEVGEQMRQDIMNAALLHDVVEDTGFSLDDLAQLGYNETVVEMVGMLSRDRKDGLTYQQWVQSIADSGNLGAILIKLSDNEDNSDPARIAALPEAEQNITLRYERSMLKLRAGLTKMGLADVG